MEQETCVTYSGGGGGTSTNGESNSSNDDDCGGSGGTTGTVIIGTQPLTGEIGGGCAPNDTLGLIPNEEEPDDCIVSPAVENNLLNCLADNGIFMTEAQNFLLNPENSCVVPDIAMFLSENGGCTAENEAFLELAIETLENDGEVNFEEKLIFDSTFKNNDRLKCIYEKLKNGNNTISTYIENFFGESPVARLKLSLDTNFQANNPNNPNAGAKTIEPQNYIIEIVFNADSNSSGSLENYPTIILASDLIHEILHAEMYRKLLSVAQEPEIPWSEEFINGIKDDFPTLAEYYLRWKYGNPSQPAATAQHQLMADYYRNIIVDALKDFDNNSHQDEFYQMLAWSGLVGTVAWNNLSQMQQNNYENQFNTAIQNETFDCNN